MNNRHVRNLQFRHLREEDATTVAVALNAERNDYIKYFHPFEFNEAVISEILSNSQLDQYIGLFCDTCFAGFYMLRGLDESYTVPSFGMYVSSGYANSGLGKVIMAHCFDTLKAMEISEVRLSVYEQNKAAVQLYKRWGFSVSGTSPGMDNKEQLCMTAVVPE